MQNSFGWLTISQILMSVKLVLHFTLLHLCSAFLRFFVFADLWGSDECGFGSLKMRLMGFNWRKSALTFFESLKWVFVCWNLKERVTERNLNEILSSLDSQQAWIHTLLYAYPKNLSIHSKNQSFHKNPHTFVSYMNDVKSFVLGNPIECDFVEYFAKQTILFMFW